MRRSLLLLAVASSLLTTACGSDATAPTIENTAFSPGLNVNLAAMTRTASGMYLQDLQVGTGAEAVTGGSVSTRYLGWLPNGTLFDSNIDPSRSALTFTLGTNAVIQGWNEGIVGMRVGGIRRLVIPPSLGYGSQSVGPIPGNSILVFEVRLVGVQ